MSVVVTLNNTQFNIPSPGEDPGWGEETTAYLVEIASVLNTLFGPGDILETTFNISNNVSVAENVVGLSFGTGTVRAAIIDYSIYRVSDSNPSGNSETGIITIIYDNSASVGSKWIVTQEKTGDAGVTFDVLDTGQFQYTSTDIGATNYSAIMKFKARTLSQ